jgi:hypothetical protein
MSIQTHPQRYQTTLKHWVICSSIAFVLATIITIPLLFLLNVPFVGSLLFLAGGMLIGNLSAQITLKLMAKRGRSIVIASGIGVGLGALVALLILFGGRLSLMLLLLTVLAIVLAIRSLQQTLQ